MKRQMSKVSLSNLFNKQISSIDKIETIRITRSFKRIERMIDGLKAYNLDVTKMTLKVRVGKKLSVVVMVIPPSKIIAKKIVRA